MLSYFVQTDVPVIVSTLLYVLNHFTGFYSFKKNNAS